jgi:hypothetical protein
VRNEDHDEPVIFEINDDTIGDGDADPRAEVTVALDYMDDYGDIGRYRVIWSHFEGCPTT